MLKNVLQKFYPLIGRLADLGIGKLPLTHLLWQKFIAFLPSSKEVELGGNLGLPSFKMIIQPQRDILERDFLLLGRIYEKETTLLFLKMLRRGMTVVDLGAHVGYYTIIAAKLIGEEGRVYAFEPEANNFNSLSRNVEINNLTNVILIQKAVSDKNGKERFYIDAFDSGRCSFLIPQFQRIKSSVYVPTVTLDEFFFQKGIQIDLLKMDIEGAEVKALRGAKRLLTERRIRTIIFEFFPEALQSQGASPRELWNILTSYEFKIYQIEENGELSETTLEKALKREKVGVFNLCALRDSS